jgi:hypothetical protein
VQQRLLAVSQGSRLLVLRPSDCEVRIGEQRQADPPIVELGRVRRGGVGVPDEQERLGVGPPAEHGVAGWFQLSQRPSDGLPVAAEVDRLGTPQ